MEPDEFSEKVEEQSGENPEAQMDPDNPDYEFSLLEREFTQVATSKFKQRSTHYLS